MGFLYPNDDSLFLICEEKFIFYREISHAFVLHSLFEYWTGMTFSKMPILVDVIFSMTYEPNMSILALFCYAKAACCMNQSIIIRQSYQVRGKAMRTAQRTVNEWACQSLNRYLRTYQLLFKPWCNIHSIIFLVTTCNWHLVAMILATTLTAAYYELFRYMIDWDYFIDTSTV